MRISRNVEFAGIDDGWETWRTGDKLYLELRLPRWVVGLLAQWYRWRSLWLLTA